MKNIFAAFVITLFAVFPSIATAEKTVCETPRDVLQQARQAGSTLIGGIEDQELVRAKEFVSGETGVAVEELEFDLIEAYSHPDPSVYVLIRYKEGCAIGGGPLPVILWDDLLTAAKGTAS